MNKYIILTTSFILDFILTNIILFQYQNITYFQPLFMITSIFLVYPLFNNSKNYFIAIFVYSIIYGSVFMHNILLGAFIFLIIAYITKLYYRYINLNFLTLILAIVMIVILYDSLLYTSLSIALVSDFSINLLFYKIKHSLIINIIYSLLLYFCHIKQVLKPSFN